MEGGDQHAAVHQVQMKVLIERGISRGGRLGAGAGRLGRVAVLAAGAERDDRPGQRVLGQRRLHSTGEALAQADHPLEGLVGEHLRERRAGGRERERVAGERAAHSARVLVVRVLLRRDPLGQLGRDPVRADGHAAADRLAERHGVRLEPPRRRAPSGPRAERVRLVDDEERAVLRAEPANVLHEARLRQDDPDVRERGLHQEAGDVAVLEHGLHGPELVELRHPRGLGGIERRPHEALAGAGEALLVEHHERLVDRAVVAPVEDSDPRTAGHVPAHPDHPAVRVGGSERELPVGHAEAPGELGADPGGILGREHRGDALDAGERPHRRPGRVARHGAGVPEAEVGVLDAVHVHERGPVRPVEVEREAAGPHRHPGHRDAREEARARLLVELPGARVVPLEPLALARGELGQAHAGGSVGERRARLVGPHGRHLLGAPLLPHGDDHHRHREQEDHRRDHVDLRWDRHARGAPDEERERDRRARVEVRDHEVVDREREREQRRRHDTGHDQGQRHEAERLPRRGPEVLRGLLQRAVEADQPRAHRDHHERQVEHDVRDQDRAEAASRPRRSGTARAARRPARPRA